MAACSQFRALAHAFTPPARATPPGLADRDMPEPRIAIIIAAGGEPVLVNEAIESVLAQETEEGFVVVATAGPDRVEEVREVLAGWRTLHPDRFHAAAARNPGWAASRNCGLEYALSVFGEIDALFVLSPEDRLQPHAICCFRAALDGEPDIGWFVPSFDLFGFDGPALARGEYSLPLHRHRDISEAGILLRSGVLRSGLRYDESAPDHLANWDLSLACARSGVPGAVLEARSCAAPARRGHPGRR
jgi:glycosyltransferase involved in cell wall biosynthesis